MQKTVLLLVFLSLCLPLVCGCQSKGENTVIGGSGNEITQEMIETEEAELKTTP